MPWITSIKHKPPHNCRRPMIWFWRKEGSLWQCPDCGWIWKVGMVGAGVRPYKDYVLEDSRGFPKNPKIYKKL